VGRDLRIVDPHVHLWDLSRARYGWLQDDPLPNNPAGDMSPIAHRDYLLKDYLADTANWRVDKIVHVEAGQPRGHQLAETDWLQALSDDYGYPHGIVAGADLTDPDLEALLEAHAARRNVRGVRQIVCWHADPKKTYNPADPLLDPNWRTGFGKLARHGLSFDLQLYPSQMARAVELADAHPDIPLIINHAGLPTDRDAEGAMFASDFPVERVHGSFDAFYSAFDDITRHFSADERDRLFAANAEAIYRI